MGGHNLGVVNHAGALASSTWDLTADEHHLTASCTLNAASTQTISPGATPMPIRFDGNFNISTSTSGTINSLGTSGAHVRWQQNGAATTWSGAAFLTVFIDNAGGSGTWNFNYNDFIVPTISLAGSGTQTVTNCTLYYSRPGQAANCLYMAATAGTCTVNDIDIAGSESTNAACRFIPSGGTWTIARVSVRECANAVQIAPTGGTSTISDIKIARCATGLTLGGTVAATLTNVSISECDTPFTGQPGASSTYTRLMVQSTRANLNTVPTTPVAGVVMTFTECYIAGSRAILTNLSVVTARVVASGSVFYRHFGGRSIDAVGVRYVTSSTNDIVGAGDSVPAAGLFAGTSNNDYLAGNAGAWYGAVPLSADGFLQDWNDSNFSANVDVDSGNTTSTSTPSQYGGPLDSNRTNALAAPNKPLTITSISSGTPTSEAATITFTTGIKARSRLLISTTSGNTTRALAEMTTPWKYHGILDPEMVDFTLPVTSHSHALVNLKAGTTYYYVIECYDPCGRRFLSTEQSFATTAAAGGGAARSGFAGAGMRVS